MAEQKIQHLLDYINNLQSGSYFFSVFLLTILITRIVLLPRKRIISPKVRGVHVHHYVYGLMLIALSFVVSSLTVFAVGVGLFVDELPLFGTERWLFSEEDWHWGVYDSPKSLTILLFSIFIVYLFRGIITPLLPHFMSI